MFPIGSKGAVSIVFIKGINEGSLSLIDCGNLWIRGVPPAIQNHQEGFLGHENCFGKDTN
jgi:hypothetical protein